MGPNDVILEVGSGTGALTTLMAARGAAVVAVDVDPAMAKLTAEAVAGLPNVRVLNRDALANKNRLNPEVLDNVRAGLAAGSGKQLKLVANLPYHVATPRDRQPAGSPRALPGLDGRDHSARAGRADVCAAASPAYGAVSVVIQGLADVSIVRSLPPTVFWPRPQVDSAVVAIRPDAAKRAAVGDVAWFHEIVRRVFFHRRKYIRHVLAGAWRDRWTKTEVDVWLEEQGFSGQLRAESLRRRGVSRAGKIAARTLD